MYALNGNTGAQLWSQDTGCGSQSSPALGANGLVIVACAGVMALSAASGTIVWSNSAGSGHTIAPYGSPTIAQNGLVYTGNGVDSIYAINMNTGATVWSFATGNFIESSPALSFDGLIVYVTSTDYKVYALDAVGGAQLWTYSTGGSVTSSPTVANGVVFVGSSDTKLYALNSETGAVIWEYTTGSAIQYSTPALVAGIVYVGSGNSVFAVHADTGTQAWSYTTGFSITSSPAVAANEACTSGPVCMSTLSTLRRALSFGGSPLLCRSLPHRPSDLMGSCTLAPPATCTLSAH